MELPVSEVKNVRHESMMPIQTLLDLGRLIRRYRQTMGLTLDQLAAATGISKPYLSNIENARLVGPPSGDKLTLLEKALRISTGELTGHADWLRTPETIRQLMPEKSGAAVPRHNSGAVDLDKLLRQEEFSAPAHQTHDLPTPDRVNPADPFPTLVHIPIINRVAAGAPAEFTDLDYPVGVADAYIPAPAQASRVDAPAPQSHPEAGMFALRVEGDSMSPHYLPGDIIVLSTVDTPADGDDCLIRLDEHGNFATTFKRIYFVDAQGHAAPDASHVQLHPLNPLHAQRLVAREKITGLYPAVWKITPTPRRASTGPTSALSIQSETSKQPQSSRRKHRLTVQGAIAAQPTSPIQSATQGFAIESD